MVSGVAVERLALLPRGLSLSVAVIDHAVGFCLMVASMPSVDRLALQLMRLGLSAAVIDHDVSWTMKTMSEGRHAGLGEHLDDPICLMGSAMHSELSLDF